MCTLKWIRGAYICPASWPGFKNTIADLVCNCRKKLWLYVRYGDFSRLFCSMFLAVHSVCMLAVVVAVLIAYDYDCARTLWASRPFGGEAALARRESLQLRPCWPNTEPQMIGQKEEKKSWVARPVSQTNQRPPKPALNREGNKLWVRKLTPFLGPDLVLQTSFLRMHVHLKVNPWRIHLPCQLTRLQKHDSRSCVQLSQKIMALCPLWWFQPPILQHVFSCALCVYACSRSSCVDRIWLWLCKDTLSK